MSCDHQDQHDEVEFLEAMMAEAGEFEWREETEGGRDDGRIITGTLNAILHLETPLIVELARRERVKAGSLGKRSPSLPHPEPGFSSANGTSSTRRKTGGRAVSKVEATAPSRSITTRSPAGKLRSGSTSSEGQPSSEQASSKMSDSGLEMGRSDSSGASNPSRPSQKRTAEILHLTPITLQFQFPHHYPSKEKPVFSLSCKWLNFTQLSLLCVHLDHLWAQDPGSVVLYNWQQFLSNEALTHLGISSKLLLEFQDPTTPRPTWDPRAIQDIDHPLLVLPSLIEHDKKEREKLFADSFFDCEICFLSLQGSKCLRITPCGHTHCRDCLKGHVVSKIDQGDVTKVDCPSFDCEEILSPNIVKQLVSPEAFERYDKLLLQRTLDGMQDVVYCPRPSCNCVTVKEDDSDMGICPRCRFSFCVLCRRAWHGVSPCRLLPADISDLRKTWEALDEDSRKALELQYGKTKLYQSFEEYDSHRWIDTNAKLCPKCTAKIQKIHGCNKMMCTQCRSHFCWLCDAPISRMDPYAHFRVGNSRCAGKLFEGLQELNEEDFFF